MDHQLEDSLNLESAMGVEFHHGDDVVVSQEDVMDGSRHDEGIPMEFEHIKEQPMLMETGHEEIISTGLMSDQFTIGGDTEYVDMACSVPLDQESHGLVTTIVDSQPQMTPETMMDLQFEPQTMYTSTPTTSTQQTSHSVKPRTSRPVAIAPKEVAIAPKPGPIVSKPFFTTKQYTLAPKTGLGGLAGPRTTLKKVHVTGVGQKAEQAVIAQIGKQLVMLPTGSSHKIKLVQSGGISMAQLLNTKNVVGTQAVKKSVVTKVMVHNESGVSEQSAVITKLSAAGSGATGAPRFVTMQQRTVPVPLSVHNKVVMGATTNTVRFSKPKQTVVSVKSSPSKLVSLGKVAPGQKLLISNAPKNLVLKQAIPHKSMTTTQVVKADGRERPVNMTVNMSGGQRAELHEVNGVQYIRLVSNATTPTSTKVVNATPKQGQVVALPANKTIMVTDKMGNLIQMGADKVMNSQPPPLVFTTTQGNKVSVPTKPQQRLVRIAPVMTKTTQANTLQPRPGQSLLAPITPDPPPPAAPTPPSEEDSKAALRQLIEDVNKEVAEHTEERTETYADDNSRGPQHEVEVAFERMSSPVQKEDRDSSSPSPRAEKKQQLVCKQEHQEHPLIVIPASYVHEQHDSSHSDRRDHSADLSTLYEERFRYGNSFINADVSGFPQPMSPPNLDNDLDNRPRKACNCTKSQCLKLYCDCFANGEFCNRCNCNNCHNNLENEELRQKAIRGCLDRNPNAFRPKIGKSKAGGPETVRRHNKGCNCKRSGCLKNYCECYEAKIACTAICKCVGCRNVEEALERLLRRREAQERKGADSAALFRPPPLLHVKQPCTFMTTEVIEAVCQCLIAAAAEHDPRAPQASGVPVCEDPADPVKDVLDEFARCLKDIISAAHQGPPIDEVPIL